MKSTLRFLGTGGDAFVVGRQLRSSGGLIMNLEGNQFHLDPGPGALVRAHQAHINLRENIGIMVSQNTLVHANDLNAVIFGMTHGGLDRFGVIVCPRKVRKEDNPQGLLFPASEQCVERVILLDESERIGINNIDIRPIQHKRPETGAIGFHFTIGNNSIAYVSDTEYFDGLAKAVGKANVLIVWCRHPSGVSERGTLNVDNVIDLIDRVNPKVCFLTGLGMKMLDADPISQARTIQRKTKTTVITASDNMEVDLENYADRMKQQKLKQPLKK